MKIEKQVFFKVNDFITLKLENGRINIYVKDLLFNQCKHIIFNLPIDRLEKFDEINSIDEVILIY